MRREAGRLEVDILFEEFDFGRGALADPNLGSRYNIQVRVVADAAAADVIALTVAKAIGGFGRRLDFEICIVACALAISTDCLISGPSFGCFEAVSGVGD